MVHVFEVRSESTTWPNSNGERERERRVSFTSVTIIINYGNAAEQKNKTRFRSKEGVLFGQTLNHQNKSGNQIKSSQKYEKVITKKKKSERCRRRLRNQTTK